MYLLQVLGPLYFDDGLAVQLSGFFLERSEEILIDVELQADEDLFYMVSNLAAFVKCPTP